MVRAGDPGERRKSQRGPARAAGALRETAASQGAAGAHQEARGTDEGAHDRRRHGHRRRALLPGTIRYDTRCYFNVLSKAYVGQLNQPHGTNN